MIKALSSGAGRSRIVMKVPVTYPSALLLSSDRPPALVQADDPTLPPSNKANYTCPQGHPMKLRQGKVRQWHFSHLAAETRCNGEGDVHRALKYGLARHLEQTLDARSAVWVERDYGLRRPDIWVRGWDPAGRLIYITIEIQHSSIDIDVVRRRVRHDVSQRWCPVWVFTHNLVHLPDDVHHGMLIKELRIPNAAAWLMNDAGTGLVVSDPTGRLWHLHMMQQIDRNKKTQDAKYFNVLVSSVSYHLAVLPKREVPRSNQRYRVATFLPRTMPPRLIKCDQAGTLLRLRGVQTPQVKTA